MIKYLLFKSLMQYLLFKNAIEVFKYTKINNYIYDNDLKNSENIENNNKYLALPLNQPTKQFLKRQVLFDIIEFLVEFKRYRRPTSLSHHFLAVSILTIIYKYGNNGNAIPLIIMGMNQFTAVLGFNLFAILKKLKFSTNIRNKHEIFMKLLQICFRIPILSFAMSTIIEILFNNNNSLKPVNKSIYYIELIGGFFQLYNEIAWLKNE